MSWRYDVFQCTNETADHNTCEAFGGPPVEIFWDGRWKDAYYMAEDLPHAIVVRQYKGELGYGKKSVTVFEHVEGGATCFYCRERRGALCKTPNENRFICPECRSDLRRSHAQAMRSYCVEPTPSMYAPIILTLDLEA
jgi:hypothetical protein